MRESFHPDDGLLQAHLEGDLDEPTHGGVSEHLAGCPACRARSDEWALLLRELDELPMLEPSQALRTRVLERVPLRTPVTDVEAATEDPLTDRPSLLDRFRAALPGAWARRRNHIRPRSVQDALDGLAGSAAHGRIQAHAAGCAACRDELSAWERMYAALGRLGHLDPSPGFRLRVLLAVREAVSNAEARASREQASAGTRWADGLRSLLPSSRRGWAFATALVAAPALGLLVVAAIVALHPLLTASDLLAFVGLRAGDAVQLASAWVIEWLGGTELLFSETGPVRTILSSPGLAVLGIAGLWTLMTFAGWIIYAHVVAPALPASRHAHATS